MGGERGAPRCVCVYCTYYKRIGAMKCCGKRCVHVCETAGMEKEVSGMQYSVNTGLAQLFLKCHCESDQFWMLHQLMPKQHSIHKAITWIGFTNRIHPFLADVLPHPPANIPVFTVSVLI